LNNLGQTPRVVVGGGGSPDSAAADAFGSAGQPGSPLLNGVRLVRYFFRKPRRAQMLALARFRVVSNGVAFLYGREAVRPRAGEPTLFPDVDVEGLLTGMRRDGLFAGINLAPDAVARIVEYARNTECFWNARPDVRFRYEDHAAVEAKYGTRVLLGRYAEIDDRCPAVRAVSHDPMLRYIAARHLGREPGQTETRLWWSFAGDATPEERFKADQGFHYDLHDYRRIAFFFHLTDVDESAGPHECVKGSHVKKPWRMLLRETRHATEAEIHEHYPAEDILTMCGPSGFGFATDPFGYHRGSGPVSRDRLILRVRFTIFDDGVRVDREVTDAAPQPA